MTILDFSGSRDLLVHSPVELNAHTLKQLRELGTVRYVVAPNKLHHLYVANFMKSFPRALLFIAPGLEKKRTDLKNAEILKNSEEYPWSPFIKHHVVSGVPICNEVILFHSESRTLIVTDIGLHIGDNNSFYTRLAFKAMGMFGKFGWSSLEKRLFIKDYKKFDTSVLEILKWDFDKIILSHGDVVRSGGKKQFQNAFARYT